MRRMMFAVLALGAALSQSACWEPVSYINEDRAIPEKARGEVYLNLKGTSLEALKGEGHGDEGHEAE